MLDRFGTEARQAVSLAGDEARRLGHGHIGTEHLLLGLIGRTGTTASQALVGAGASLVPAREKVVEALANRTPRAPVGPAEDLPYTDRAARTLDRAGKLSLRTGSEQVLCEHILLSVLDVEGTAGQVLRGLGVDPESVRKALRSQVPVPPQPEEEPEEEERASPEERLGSPPRGPGPLCGSCGASLIGHLDRMAVRLGGAEAGGEVDLYYCTVCGTTVGLQRR